MHTIFWSEDMVEGNTEDDSSLGYLIKGAIPGETDENHNVNTANF